MNNEHNGFSQNSKITIVAKAKSWPGPNPWLKPGAIKENFRDFKSKIFWLKPGAIFKPTGSYN